MFKIVVFQGPSGAGKSTLQQKLGIPRIVTWTTRDPRPYEQNGVDYHFVTVEELQYMQRSGRMLEVTEYKSNYYGISIDSITTLNNEVRSVVVDASGSREIKKYLNQNCFCIGVYATKSNCESRLLKRSQSLVEVNKRLKDYENEIQALFDCDLIINNSDSNWDKVDWILQSLKSINEQN